MPSWRTNSWGARGTTNATEGAESRTRRAQIGRAIAVLLGACLAIGAAAKAAGKPGYAKVIAKIQRADYEGDRAALKQLYGELAPLPEDNHAASRVQYWRGFALWRRAINGFNENANLNEQQADLEQAVKDFEEARAKDPGFADAESAEAGCLMSLLYVKQQRKEPGRELVQQFVKLIKESAAAEPENPRVLWVLGGDLWYAPPAAGGGQDQAMATYQKGLDAARKARGSKKVALEPSWGEPELLMSLAWGNLNKKTPDLDAAETNARAALKIVPYWHYVRDILMAQIRDAKAKQAANPPGTR